MITFWMNIDKPKRRCTVHSKVCRYSIEKKETSLKGIGKVKRAGGWMPFISIEEATKYFDDEWYNLGYTFFPCRFCIELKRNRIGFKQSLRAR